MNNENDLKKIWYVVEKVLEENYLYYVNQGMDKAHMFPDSILQEMKIQASHPLETLQAQEQEIKDWKLSQKQIRGMK